MPAAIPLAWQLPDDGHCCRQFALAVLTIARTCGTSGKAGQKRSPLARRTKVSTIQRMWHAYTVSKSTSMPLLQCTASASGQVFMQLDIADLLLWIACEDIYMATYTTRRSMPISWEGRSALQEGHVNRDASAIHVPTCTRFLASPLVASADEETCRRLLVLRLIIWPVTSVASQSCLA